MNFPYFNSLDILKKNILKGSIFSIILKIWSAIAVFLMHVFIARRLGAEDAGYFFLSYSIIILMAILARHGFDKVLVRFIAAANDLTEINQLYTYALSRVVIVSFIISTILFFTANFISNQIFSKPEMCATLQLMSVIIFPLAISMIHSQTLQGLKLVVKSLLVMNTITPTLLILALAMINIKNIDNIIILFIAVHILNLIISVIFLRSAIKIKFILPDLSYISEIKQTLYPMFGTIIFHNITSRVALILLGIWASSIDIAIFSVAQRTSILISFFIFAVNAVISPRFASLYNRNDLQELKKIAIFSVNLLFVSCFPIFILMVCFPKPILALFGSEYLVGSNILIILSFGQFISVISGSVIMLLQMTGHQNEVLVNSVITFIVVLILGIILIPKYGIMGAAIVCCLELIIKNILCAVTVKRKLGFFIIPQININKNFS